MAGMQVLGEARWSQDSVVHDTCYFYTRITCAHVRDCRSANDNGRFCIQASLECSVLGFTVQLQVQHYALISKTGRSTVI